MKFEILRASDYIRPKKAPCDGAVQEGNYWFIEINSLEELVALQDAVGDLVVSDKQIWIYDCYME